MEKYLFAGLGGFIGSACRFGVAGFMYKILGDRFPYGTLTVNVIGCFVIGVLLTAMEDRFLVQPNFRIFLTIGVLGGFTTFSSFSFETIELLKAGDFLLGSMNAIISLIGCLAATWVGTMIGKIL
jgi:fluoride exporter